MFMRSIFFLLIFFLSNSSWCQLSVSGMLQNSKDVIIVYKKNDRTRYLEGQDAMPCLELKYRKKNFHIAYSILLHEKKYSVIMFNRFGSYGQVVDYAKIMHLRVGYSRQLLGTKVLSKTRVTSDVGLAYNRFFTSLNVPYVDPSFGPFFTALGRTEWEVKQHNDIENSVTPQIRLGLEVYPLKWLSIIAHIGYDFGSKQLVGSGTYKNFSTAGVLVEEGNLSNWGAYQFYNLGLMIQPISLLKRK
jgi:hypothetical protein